MSMFDQFKDIEARDEIPIVESTIEKLLALETKVINAHLENRWVDDQTRELERIYTKIITQVREELPLQLTEEILQEYIDCRENRETDRAAKIRGMYSAALVDMFQEQNPDTPLTIDGNGRRWNYLFYHVKKVKYLNLTNVRGEYILAFAGTERGSIEDVIVQNIEGDNLFTNAATFYGKMKKVTFQNCSGEELFFNMGAHDGTVNTIFLDNIKGRIALGITFDEKEDTEKLYLKNPDKSPLAFTTNNNLTKRKKILLHENCAQEKSSIVQEIETLTGEMISKTKEEPKKGYEVLSKLYERLFED